MEITGNTLIGIKVFETLSIEQRDVVATLCSGRAYQRGAQIVSQDDQSDDVFFVLSGEVRATVLSEQGKEVIFQDLEAGDMFGEMAAIDARPRSTNVMAQTDATLVVVKGEVYRQLLQDYPAIATATLRRLTDLVRRHCERIYEFSTLGVKNRLHAELLRIGRKHQIDGDNRVVIENAPTNDAIGSRISARREPVNQELKDLERNGFIRWTRSEHVILDLEGLQKLVDDVHHTP